jgi:hypothetical protein
MVCGGTVGLRRRIKSMLDNRHDNDRDKGADKWQIDIEGAMAELAAAKALGMYWPATVDTFKGPDIGDDIQVRWTKYNDGRLLYRNADSTDEYYVLVTGCAPGYEVRGWILGAHARRDEWADNPGGMGRAYFVPQSHLQPISDLRVMKGG